MSVPNKPAYRFITRWVVCGLGTWIAAGLLNNHIHGTTVSAIVIFGFILAVINTVLKPFIIILSLPALLFSLGLFMVVINGLTFFIASKLDTHIKVNNFWDAIFAGMVIGLVNYLVSTILEDVKAK
jgi:putative membrane protein